MARNDRNQRVRNESSAPHAPVEQAISGRLYGSDTDLESQFDARHDISNIDCQEGTMNHGTKGGCFDDEKEGLNPA